MKYWMDSNLVHFSFIINFIGKLHILPWVLNPQPHLTLHFALIREEVPRMVFFPSSLNKVPPIPSPPLLTKLSFVLLLLVWFGVFFGGSYLAYLYSFLKNQFFKVQLHFSSVYF